MHWDPCGIWGQFQDDPTPLDVLGLPDHGGQVWWLFWASIFNLVVDAIIRHWVIVVAPTANCLEGFDLLVG